MSFYNALCGMTPGAAELLELIELPPDSIPRFRDCFLDDQLHIVVYTRTGGGNRECYADGNTRLTGHPLYVSDHDDDFDCTFANFLFRAPDSASKEALTRFYEMTTKVVGTPRERFDKLLSDLKSPAKRDSPGVKNALEVGERIMTAITEAVDSPGGSGSVIEIGADGTVQTKKGTSMACAILEGKEGCCFYCTVTDWCFGPLMKDLEQAERFMKWLECDPRSLSNAELAHKWDAFVHEPSPGERWSAALAKARTPRYATADEVQLNVEENQRWLAEQDAAAMEGLPGGRQGGA